MKKTTKIRKAAKPAARPDTVAFLDDVFGQEAGWTPLVEKARINSDVAHAIYDLRTAHSLTQHQLAELIGSTQPVVARLEDADYTGHSLTMLSRIAAALDRRVEVQFVPLHEPARAAVQSQVSAGGGSVVRTAASAAAPRRRKSAAGGTARPVKTNARRTSKSAAKRRSSASRQATARSVVAREK